MRINNTADLFGYLFLALFGAFFIYYSWRWILGALAFFGFAWLLKLWNRNDRHHHNHNYHSHRHHRNDRHHH